MTHTIKHYWDEENYGTKVTPGWITSSEKVSAEKARIREIMNQLLSPAEYNRLSEERPGQGMIGDYTVKYHYTDKDDPDPSNSRKVVDITFYVSKKRSWSKWVFVLIGLIAIASIVMVFPHPQTSPIKSDEAGQNQMIGQKSQTARPTDTTTIQPNSVITGKNPVNKSDANSGWKYPEACEKRAEIRKCLKTNKCGKILKNTCLSIYIKKICSDKQKEKGRYPYYYSVEKMPDVCSKDTNYGLKGLSREFRNFILVDSNRSFFNQ